MNFIGTNGSSGAGVYMSGESSSSRRVLTEKRDESLNHGAPLTQGGVKPVQLGLQTQPNSSVSSSTQVSKNLLCLEDFESDSGYQFGSYENSNIAYPLRSYEAMLYLMTQEKKTVLCIGPGSEILEPQNVHYSFEAQELLAAMPESIITFFEPKKDLLNALYKGEFAHPQLYAFVDNLIKKHRSSKNEVCLREEEKLKLFSKNLKNIEMIPSVKSRVVMENKYNTGFEIYQFCETNRYDVIYAQHSLSYAAEGLTRCDRFLSQKDAWKILFKKLYTLLEMNGKLVIDNVTADLLKKEFGTYSGVLKSNNLNCRVRRSIPTTSDILETKIKPNLGIGMFSVDSKEGSFKLLNHVVAPFFVYEKLSSTNK